MMSTVWYYSDWIRERARIQEYTKNNPKKPDFVGYCSNYCTYYANRLNGTVRLSWFTLSNCDGRVRYELEVRADGAFDEYEELVEDGFYKYIIRETDPAGNQKTRERPGCPVDCKCGGSRYFGDCQKDGFAYWREQREMK